MVKITDGENTFEIVDYHTPGSGEWFLTAGGGLVHACDGLNEMPRHILRPISGPVARQERRLDSGTREWVEDARSAYVSGKRTWLDNSREAYRRGQRMPRKEAE